MRSRASSRTLSRQGSQGRVSPNVTPLISGKSMKLPMIGNGQEEIPGTTTVSVWNQAKAPAPASPVGVCSQQGKRPYQEDEFAIRQYLNHGKPDAPETHFFGLFDGHAGGKCSAHVAGNLPSILTDDEFFVSNLPQAIKRAFHTVNEQFLKIAEKMKLHDGSTGLCALIRDNKILVANAGDCRALLVSSGRPIPLSNDHKPTSPDEQKRIAALGGSIVYCMGVARVNRVLAVSRAFGNRTLRTVIRPDAELMQRELVEGDDFLVMASDGLWDVLKNKDVCDVCYSPFLQRKPQQIADELVHLALARGSMDNVTCIVVNLNEFRNKSNSSEDTRQMPFVENNNVHQSNFHRTQDMYRQQHGIATDFDDNDTVDLSNGNNQTQTISLNTPGKRVNKHPSNNNLLHDGLPKQYSLGNLRGGEENVSSNEMADNIATMKRSINSSQNNQRLLRGASTNSIPTMDSSFPAVGNGLPSSSNQETLTGKLFTPVTGIDVMNRQQLSSSKLRSNAVTNLRNSVSNVRGGNNNNNNNLDATQTISRASLNDLSNMLNDFNATTNY